MRRSSRVPRLFVAVLCGLFFATVFALPAGAQRLRSPASSLVLATPTVTCGSSPRVNLSWTDTAPSATGTYRVMSNTIGGKANAWSAGPYLGNVSTTSVGAANNSSWQFAIHAVTSVTRDSNVVSITIACAPVDGTAPTAPTITSISAPSCSSVTLAWSTVTDTGGSGLAGYNVFRDGSFVQRVNAPATSWTNTSLAASTAYSYRVSAIDNSGNQSAQSTAMGVTTPSCVDQPPVANAGPDQSVPTLVSVSFNGGSSSDPDGTISSYAWDFGDGATASGVSVSHVYASAGAYTATLTVTDNQGVADPDAATITVSNRAPIANAGADKSATAGTAVSFNGSGSSDPDGTIASYAWNFGDGTSASGVSTSHAYAAAGTFTVTLTVTDNKGATASDTAVVTIGAVVNQAPHANAGADQSAQTLVALSFNGSGSTDADGTISSYNWSFGDGATATGVSASHTYASSGVYTVTLTVTDNQGAIASDTAVATITNRPPVANAGADRSAQTLVAQSFSGAGSTDADGTISSYAWSFGDGATATGVSASHTYASSGVYTVTLTVTDNKGATASDTAVATITNRPPVANAGADQGAQTLVALSFNGSGSSDPDGTISSYAWNFGDGASGSGMSAAHSYASSGSYTVTLTVTDNKGATATDTAVVTVGAVASTNWSKEMGGVGSDSVSTITADAAGNTYVAGIFNDSITIGSTPLTSAGAGDVFLAKYAPNGSVLWAHRMGGTSGDTAYGLAVDAAGNVDLVGSFSGNANYGGSTLVGTAAAVGGSPIDIYVAQYNGATGAHQWSKSFGSGYSDEAKAVAVDTAGNIYFTGYFRNVISFGGTQLKVPYDSDLDVFIAKFTSGGAHVWSKNFTNTGNDQGYGIAVDGQGNVAIGGSFSNSINFGGGDLVSENAMTDAFVADFTTNGVYRWQREIGAPDGSEGVRGVAVDGSGNVVIAGAGLKAFDLGGGSTAALGGSDGFVAKYAAASGAYQWAARLGGTGNDYANAVAVDSAGNMIVAGSFEGTANFSGASASSLGASDAFVVKYTNAGARSWLRSYGSASADWFNGVGATPGTSANPVLGGYFYGSATFEGSAYTSAGMADGLVIRTTP